MAGVRHKVYPVVRVYKEGILLREASIGNRAKIDSAEVEFNMDIIDNNGVPHSNVEVLVRAWVDKEGHGHVRVNKKQKDLIDLE